MSYLFSDMQSKLSSLLGDPNTTTDDQWPLAVRKKELNRGEMQFCMDTKLVREYATSTVSSMTINFPSDLLEIHVLYVLNTTTNGYYKVTNDREISVKDLERYSSYGGDIPFYYIWEASGVRQMNLLGAASSINGKTYKLYYIKKPSTEMSSDSDTSILPEEFREAPVYYAAAQLLDQIGKSTLSDRYMAKYNEFVIKAQIYISRRDVDWDLPRPDQNYAATTVIDTIGTGNPQ